MDAYSYHRGKKNHRWVLRQETKTPLNRYRIFIEGKELKSSPAKGQYALRGDLLTFTRKQIDNLFNIVDGKRFISYRFFWDCSNTMRKKYQKHEYKAYKDSCNHHVEIKIVPVKNVTVREARDQKNIESTRQSVLNRFLSNKNALEADLKRLNNRLDKVNKIIKSF